MLNSRTASAATMCFLLITGAYATIEDLLGNRQTTGRPSSQVSRHFPRLANIISAINTLQTGMAPVRQQTVTLVNELTELLADVLEQSQLLALAGITVDQIYSFVDIIDLNSFNNLLASINLPTLISFPDIPGLPFLTRLQQAIAARN